MLSKSRVGVVWGLWFGLLLLFDAIHDDRWISSPDDIPPSFKRWCTIIRHGYLTFIVLLLDLLDATAVLDEVTISWWMGSLWFFSFRVWWILAWTLRNSSCPWSILGSEDEVTWDPLLTSRWLWSSDNNPIVTWSVMDLDILAACSSSFFSKDDFLWILLSFNSFSFWTSALFSITFFNSHFWSKTFFPLIIRIRGWYTMCHSNDPPYRIVRYGMVDRYVAVS